MLCCRVLCVSTYEFNDLEASHLQRSFWELFCFDAAICAAPERNGLLPWLIESMSKLLAYTKDFMSGAS